METGRVEAFSDGVFAIAVTLLIPTVGNHQLFRHSRASTGQ
jgi:Endosomal/lysosomal potassium channel TMEM175